MTKSFLSTLLFVIFFHFVYGQFDNEQFLVSAPNPSLIAPALEVPAYADLDNNGFVDIIGAYSQKLYAYMNMGDGIFEQELLYDFSGLGFAVYYILPWDFDNDGMMDIAMTSSSSGGNARLNIFKNTPNGFVLGLDEIYSRAHGLNATDLNGDGFDELIMGAFNKVIVFENNQGISFNQQEIPIPVGNRIITEVQCADFTNNGHPDIITLASYRRVSITPNLGNFNFASSTTFYVPENNDLSASRLCLDDLNGNGKPNVSVFYRRVNNFTFTNELVWFELNEQGEFESNSFSLPYTNGGYYGFDVGDINGDENVEMIFTYEINGNSGTLVRENPTSAEGELTEYLSNKAVNHISVKNLTRSVDLVDISGNGSLDVVLNSRTAYTLGVVYNDGDLTTPEKWYNQFSHVYHTGTVEQPRSEDVDGNGENSLTYLKDFDSYSLLMNTRYNSYEGFSEYELLSFNKWDNSKLTFRFGKGNQDSFPDIFTASQESNGVFNIKVYTGTPSGGYDAPVVVTSIPGPLKQKVTIELNDFNNDGLSDIVMQRNPMVGSSGPFVLINNGNGSFSAPQTIAASAGLLTMADIDNDGFTDLAVLVGSELKLYSNDGTGQFTLINTVPTNPGNPSQVPTKVYFVQRIANTAPDLIFTSAAISAWTSFGPLVRIQPNEGNFQFGDVENFQFNFSVPTNLTSLVGFADVTNNGLLDVIYAVDNSASTFYSPHSSLGQYGASQVIDSSPSSTSSQFILDATGNGYADYVLIKQITGVPFPYYGPTFAQPNNLIIRHNDLCIPDPACDESPECTLPYPIVTGLDQSSQQDGTILTWNPVPGSAGCRIEGGRADAQGPVITYTVLQPEASTFTVPASQLTAGVTYRWRVRCGCSLNIAGDWSAYSTFTRPLFPVNMPSNISAQSFEASIYPNPLGESGIISFDLPAASTVHFRLYDLAGKLLHQQQYSGVAGFQSYALELTNLPAGVYISQVVVGEEQHTSRLVLMR